VKLPKPKQLPSGSWFIQLRLDGQSIPITASSEKACRDEARLIKSQHKAGKRQKRIGDNLTLEQAIDQYIVARNNILSPSTIRGYEVIKRTRFKGAMNQQLRDISDWQTVVNTEAKIVSAKTLKNAWLFVASVLREVTQQEPPKVRLPQVVTPLPKFLEPEQILTFIDTIYGTYWEAEALVALHGLRASEIWALPLSGVGQEIKVRGAAVLDKNNNMIIKTENKNQESRRDVPVLIQRLSDLVAKREDKDGMLARCHQGTLRKHIDRTCRELGFIEVGIHGLRHSFASLCYDLGIPERAAMQYGGWKDRETMHQIYIHLAKRATVKSETTLRKFFESPGEENQFDADSLPYQIAIQISQLTRPADETELQKWAAALDVTIKDLGIN